jgi:hypothetical protein
MRTFGLVLLGGLVLLLSAQAADEGSVKKEQEALRGNWNLPKRAGDADVGAVTQWSMVEDSLQIRIAGNAHIDLKFTVDPSKKPKEITMTTMLALARTRCPADAGGEDGAAPIGQLTLTSCAKE